MGQNASTAAGAYSPQTGRFSTCSSTPPSSHSSQFRKNDNSIYSSSSLTSSLPDLPSGCQNVPPNVRPPISNSSSSSFQPVVFKSKLKSKSSPRNSSRKSSTPLTPSGLNAALELYFGPNVTRTLQQLNAEDRSNRREEGAAEYKSGGYHSVLRGELYNDRYLILEKLGWGHFSTVWLAADLSSPVAPPYSTSKHNCSLPYAHKRVALKIQKSDPTFYEAAVDEVKLLQRIDTKGTANYNEGRQYCLKLIDDFEVRGTFGRHKCIALDVLGENLLALVKRVPKRRLNLHVVQRIAYDILLGLDYLHTTCSIIHTDLKMENVLVGERDESICEKLANYQPQTGEVPNKFDKYYQKLATSSTSNGKSTTKSKSKYSSYQRSRSHSVSDAANYGAVPSVASWLVKSAEDMSNSNASPIINVKFDPRSYSKPLVKIADIGNACWTHHHFSDYITTRQYRAPEVLLRADYTTSVDIWSLACIIFELITGDYLFDPKPSRSKGYSRNDDHLAIIMELLGPFPVPLLKRGKDTKDYFHSYSNGIIKLRRIPELDEWKLPDLLHTKYGLSRTDAEACSSFLLPMLALDPNDRASASRMLQHPWLNVCRQNAIKHEQQKQFEMKQKLLQRSNARMKASRNPREGFISTSSSASKVSSASSAVSSTSIQQQQQPSSRIIKAPIRPSRRKLSSAPDYSSTLTYNSKLTNDSRARKPILTTTPIPPRVSPGGSVLLAIPNSKGQRKSSHLQRTTQASMNGVGEDVVVNILSRSSTRSRRQRKASIDSMAPQPDADGLRRSRWSRTPIKDGNGENSSSSGNGKRRLHEKESVPGSFANLKLSPPKSRASLAFKTSSSRLSTSRLVHLRQSVPQPGSKSGL